MLCKTLWFLRNTHPMLLSWPASSKIKYRSLFTMRKMHFVLTSLSTKNCTFSVKFLLHDRLNIPRALESKLIHQEILIHKTRKSIIIDKAAKNITCYCRMTILKFKLFPGIFKNKKTIVKKIPLWQSLTSNIISIQI